MIVSAKRARAHIGISAPVNRTCTAARRTVSASNGEGDEELEFELGECRNLSAAASGYTMVNEHGARHREKTASMVGEFT